MKIVIAGDHLAYDEITKVQDSLSALGIDHVNVGAKSPDVVTSLQSIIPKVCEPIIDGKYDSGILVCGTGAGVEIGANKFTGIRASLCRDSLQAKNARIYDNANVLCLGSWYENDISAILEAWINNSFDNDESRTQMLKDFDDWR